MYLISNEDIVPGCWFFVFLVVLIFVLTPHSALEGSLENGIRWIKMVI